MHANESYYRIVTENLWQISLTQLKKWLLNLYFSPWPSPSSNKDMFLPDLNKNQLCQNATMKSVTQELTRSSMFLMKTTFKYMKTSIRNPNVIKNR